MREEAVLSQEPFPHVKDTSRRVDDRKQNTSAARANGMSYPHTQCRFLTPYLNSTPNESCVKLTDAQQGIGPSYFNNSLADAGTKRTQHQFRARDWFSAHNDACVARSVCHARPQQNTGQKGCRALAIGSTV